MSDTNKHTGTGRLGVEPKFFTGESGTRIGKLFALLNESHVDKSGNEHKSTLPVNIVLVRPAEIAIAETLHTGTAISWEGKLARRTFEKDGREQAVFEIVIAGNGSKLTALDAKAAVGERPQRQNGHAPAQLPRQI